MKFQTALSKFADVPEVAALAKARQAEHDAFLPTGIATARLRRLLATLAGCRIL